MCRGEDAAGHVRPEGSSVNWPRPTRVGRDLALFRARACRFSGDRRLQIFDHDNRIGN
jgi:hypothetical protein